MSIALGKPASFSRWSLAGVGVTFEKAEKRREEKRERQFLVGWMPHSFYFSPSDSHTICRAATAATAATAPFAFVVTEDGISDHNGAILASINQAGQ